MSLTPPRCNRSRSSRSSAKRCCAYLSYNPEYTNYQNNTDPGVTILQLFAFMVDNLSYLCNQIPDQNRMKFLNLLGMPLQPPQAATGMVTFSNARGPLQTVTLPAQLPVFRRRPPDLLPATAWMCCRSIHESSCALRFPRHRAADRSQTYTPALRRLQHAPPTALQFYQTVAFNPPASAASPQIATSQATAVSWIARCGSRC